MLRCKMCLGLQNATAHWPSRRQSLHFSHITSPFAVCHLGMAIVVKPNRGEEPSTACCAYSNDSICWLEETQGQVTLKLDVRQGCVSKITMRTPCSTTVAFRWLTKSGQCHLFPQSCGWCAAWSLLNRSTPTICMYASLNLPIRKSCLTSVLVWPLIWVCTSPHRRVYRYVLSKVPANTDDLIVAPLTNTDFAVATSGKSSMMTHFLASWMMLADYRRSG